MAVLNAIATKESSCMLNVLFPKAVELPRKMLDVQICALIDSLGSPMDMAYIATSMVKEGFAAIKMKVGTVIPKLVLQISFFFCAVNE